MLLGLLAALPPAGDAGEGEGEGMGLGEWAEEGKGALYSIRYQLCPSCARIFRLSSPFPIIFGSASCDIGGGSGENKYGLPNNKDFSSCSSFCVRSGLCAYRIMLSDSFPPTLRERDVLFSHIYEGS